MNGITIEVYSSGTTRIGDQSGGLKNAQGLRFATGYPGGLYLDGSFYIARDALANLPIKGNMRVVFRNGQKVVYEGWVDGISSQWSAADQGVEIPLVGAWGRYIMRHSLQKHWADNRVSEDVWVYSPTPAGEPYFDVGRLTDAGPALLFEPANLAMAVGSLVRCIYTMPTGKTVKKVTCHYDLTTSAADPDWSLRLVNGSTGALIQNIVSRAAAGTTAGDFTHTLGAPVQWVGIELYSDAVQTPAGDGSTYGEITDLIVYDEVSAIDLTEIATDIVGLNSDLNSDTGYIDAITDTGGIIPFVIDRWTSHADILAHAASFGDDSFNKWAYGCLNSEKAATPNGEAVLFIEQQPALTDYDYAIRVNDVNLNGSIDIERDYSNIWNWIIVEYYDENGYYAVVTPDDDANLKDDTSRTAYGSRDYVLNVGSSTSASAIDSGRRFLAQYKDPLYVVNGSITVDEYIRKKDGSRLPAAEILAGKRIKIENYLQDLSGTGLTFLISHTDYDDSSETCSMSVGLPRDLIFPTFVFDPVGQAPGPSADSAAAGAGGGGGGGDRLNWKRKVGLVPGTPEWAEAVRIGKKAWYDKYR